MIREKKEIRKYKFRRIYTWSGNTQKRNIYTKIHTNRKNICKKNYMDKDIYIYLKNIYKKEINI